jgi:chromate transporter
VPTATGTVREVFAAFLRLGLTSFGGPIAHIGYFRREFVDRKHWLKDSEFSELVALSQSLPGPSSSQLGFAIGHRRAGWLGALAAFAGFTLPSALVLFALAGISWGSSSRFEWAVIDGLKLAAVAVVAHALLQMARGVHDNLRLVSVAIAIVSMLALVNAAWMQLAIIGAGALLGAVFSPHRAERGHPHAAAQTGPAIALFALLLFVVGCVAAVSWSSRESALTSLFAAFWGAGALVFGGGHVVLPLLDATVVSPGWMTTEVFVTGYGAAQAMPGPLFAVASFFGAEVNTGYPSAIGAITATLAIFAPGLLLMTAALPAWSRLTNTPRARGALVGINAAVVGLLAAALYNPVMLSAIINWTDALIALIALALLWNERRSALVAVAWCVLASAAVQLISAR